MGSVRSRGLFIAAIPMLVFAGCKKQETTTSIAKPAATESSIQVRSSANGIEIASKSAVFVLLPNGNLQASRIDSSRRVTLDESASPLEITIGKKHVADFSRDFAHVSIQNTSGKLGNLGKRVEVRGHSASTDIDETLVVEAYDDFPSLALLSATYKNSSLHLLDLESVELQKHKLNAALADARVKPHELYAFFGSSLKWGKDDVVPIPAKFSQDNPFGTPVKTPGDLGSVGGGIPVIAFWSQSTGLAIGHLETLPLPVSIPVKTTNDGRIEAAVEIPAAVTLKPGEIFATPRTFVTVYSGDYYQPLHTWSEAVEREGLARPKNNEENYAVSWCGWGYESNVTPKQMTDTIPMLKELGIHWATLDDRWFNNYGDWQPRTDTFGGDTIQRMVKDFHSQGVKVQLWWLPLAVEDGNYKYGDHKYVLSNVVRQHPDWLILDERGKPARMPCGSRSSRILQTID
jgi:alpha-galactosidase